MKTIKVCLLFLLFTLIISGCGNVQTKDNDQTYITNSISAENNDNGILYGKYPEPLVIAVGKNMDVNKDYKQVTKEDLKKIKNFYFENEMGKNYPDKIYGFEDNKEYDFSIILEMPNLTSLDINLGENVRLKDYSILKKLNKLQMLTIGNINNSDINNISCLTSLEWLDISNSKITNINFLRDLKQLTFFGLDNVPNVHDFQPLKNLTEIKQINLINMGLTQKELDAIPDMDTIESLSLFSNDIKSIDNFPQMKNLQYLVLENNPLISVNIASDRTPNLKSLMLNNTRMSDLNELSGVENIERIYIKGTQIRKISPLKKFKNLKEIYADTKNIDDLDQFKDSLIIYENY